MRTETKPPELCVVDRDLAAPVTGAEVFDMIRDVVARNLPLVALDDPDRPFLLEVRLIMGAPRLHAVDENGATSTTAGRA